MESTLEERKEVSTSRAIGGLIIIVVLLALYLNIGWVLGTYYHNHVLYQQPQTIAQTMAGGGWGYMSNVQSEREHYSLITNQIVFMLFWPLLMLFIAGSWVFKGVCYILWLIFAGGVAKLLGLG